jgi:hypothetical protein
LTIEFATFPAENGLPDGRAYELISPLSKDGGEVFPASPFVTNCKECLPGTNNEHFPIQSTVDGDSIVYEGDAFSATNEAVNENEYIAKRGASGWQTRDLSPEREEGSEKQGYKAFSPDLSTSVFYQTGLL